MTQTLTESKRLVAALEKSTPDDDKPLEADDNNAQTIRPNRSPSSAASATAKPPPPEIAPIVEDYSDLGIDEDDVWQEKFADFKMKNSFRKGLFHPDDIKTLGLMPSSPGPKTAPLPELGRRSSRPVLSPLTAAPGYPGPLSARSHSTSHSRSSSFVGSTNGSFGRAEVKKLEQQSEFGKYAEDDDEDYDDVFGKPNGTCEHANTVDEVIGQIYSRSYF